MPRDRVSSQSLRESSSFWMPSISSDAILASSPSSISSARLPNHLGFPDVSFFGEKSRVREPSGFSVCPTPFLTVVPIPVGLPRSMVDGIVNGLVRGGSLILRGSSLLAMGYPSTGRGVPVAFDTDILPRLPNGTHRGSEQSPYLADSARPSWWSQQGRHASLSGR